MAIEENTAGLRLKDAGDEVDEGAFARAVFPDEGVDFAGAYIEGDVGQGTDARKGATDMFQA
jgi:hypothetical protein